MTYSHITPRGLAQQSGMTLISWVVVIAFLGFQGVMAMNIVPVYLNDASVKSVVSSLADDSDIKSSTTRKIKDKILTKLKINNIYDIKPDNIVVKKGRQGVMITIEYEPRGTLVGNLEYIVTFKHEVLVE